MKNASPIGTGNTTKARTETPQGHPRVTHALLTKLRRLPGIPIRLPASANRGTRGTALPKSARSVAHATTLVHVQLLHFCRCLKSCFGQACATGELFFAGECEACPDGGSCDGSDQVSCQTTFYKFHPTPDIRPVCHQCPAVRKCFCKKYRIMTNNGERDSRVPHNSYENVTYSSRKQSECTMIDQCCIMPVRDLERQSNTPHALIPPLQTYRAQKEIGVIKYSIVSSVESPAGSVRC